MKYKWMNEYHKISESCQEAFKNSRWDYLNWVS